MAPPTNVHASNRALPNTTEKILVDLRSRNEHTQRKAMGELRSAVEMESRQMSREEFSGFITELNKRIFDLVKSDDPCEKMGGINAMDSLIDFECEETSTLITRFANYLRLVLPCNDVGTMIMASKVLGHLAQSGGTLTADFVEFEMKRALEGLNTSKRSEHQKLASLLVCKELATNAPTLFFMHVPSYLKSIWVGIRDQKQIIREAAIESLRACMTIIAERDFVVRKKWFTAVYEEAEKSFHTNSIEGVHGSLLVMGELLSLPNIAPDIPASATLSAMWETTMAYKDHRDALIRRTVISILPTVAKIDEEEFRAAYAEDCIKYLLATLKRGNESSAAFVSLGAIVKVAGAWVIESFVDDVMNLVQDGITPTPRKPFCFEAPQCLASLTTVDSSHVVLNERMPELIEQMLAGSEGNLTPALISSLSQIGKSMPLLLPDIQMKLLDSISFTLQRTPYQPSGTPNSRRIVPLRGGVMSVHSGTAKGRQNAVIQALHALTSFDFTGNQLCEFVKDCVSQYLDDQSRMVRLTAAQTCSNLLLRPGETVPKRGRTAIVVSEILERLLVTAVSDSDPQIRVIVLECLGPRFDYFLAQSHCIDSLFVALNDEVFNVQEAAIRILTRLTLCNPAHVFPGLRKVLIQLLTALEFGGEDKKEKSTRLLQHVILAGHHLVKPYVSSILDAILPKLQDSNPTVAANVLNTVGVLSHVGSYDVLKRKDDIFYLMMEALQDQSNTNKRRVATKTLGLLVQNTGFVVEPYKTYPNLLSIMLKRLQAEQTNEIRQELLKVMGILGAVDPHILKMRQTRNSSGLPITFSAEKWRREEELPGPSTDEYYPTVAVSKLVKILNDQSLSSYHQMVIQAVMFIFRTLGLKCATLLPQMMDPILNLLRSHQQQLRDFLFQQLGLLVSIVKQHIRPYLPGIFELIHEFWNQQSLQPQMLFLIGEITSALKDEFKVYVSPLIPKLLGALNKENARSRPMTCQKVMYALELMDANLELYLDVIIPAIVAIAEQEDSKLDVRVAAIQWIGRMSLRLNISDFASKIIHPLVRILEGPIDSLYKPAIITICALMNALGQRFFLFEPMLTKIIVRKRVNDGVGRYQMLLERLRSGEVLTLDDYPTEELGTLGSNSSSLESVLDTGQVRKIAVNQPNLKRAWEASHRSTKEDWADWMRRFAVELLRESPSPALRSCAALAQVYHPLARELFNAAFLSCWMELYESYRDSLMRSLEIAFSPEKSPNIPPEVLQTLLSLAEFMDHDEKPLPIKIPKLGAVAEKCQAYAKALHYKEMEFLGSPHTAIQSLISINNFLGHTEAANGLLVHAQKCLNLEVKESWYEKLHKWEEALDAYRQRLKTEQAAEAQEGCMRCLQALGEWEQLKDMTEAAWSSALPDARSRIAPLGAAAACQIGDVEQLAMYIEAMDPKSVEGCMYKAMFLVHGDALDEAQEKLEVTRRLLDTQLTALVSESYERAYKAVVITQQVTELEEVLQFKRAKAMDALPACEHIRHMWTQRLFGAQANVEVWQSLLAIHSLVIPPREYSEAWLKYASLCRKTGRSSLCYKALTKLLNYNEQLQQLESPFSPSVDPEIGFAWLKYIWYTGQREQALVTLQEFIRAQRGSHTLQARCHLKVGMWTQELHESPQQNDFGLILSAYRNATILNKNWYKAWHHWALFNFDIVSYNENKQQRNRAGGIPYVVAAVNGFIRSIALGVSNARGHVQQDILRLLTLWFRYGSIAEVERALAEGFNILPIETWLDVIPQIIARINSPDAVIRNSIHNLLIRIGKAHPQALIYPVTVASKSHIQARRDAAKKILSEMEGFAPLLVEQAKLVSKELIRVAILWIEMWHEALEEASRLYFAEGNIDGMFAVLRPMHELLQRGAQTQRELEFQQKLGQNLDEAKEFCDKYCQSKQEKDLQKAWENYYNVFRTINKLLGRITSIELEHASPELKAAKDLELSIPGQYRPGEPIVSIQSVEETLSIITSKQRPRKCTMIGSNGKPYQYLLKGHEDLRQDERVMQLFGLVNTLLHNDRECSRRDLQIVRYSVIPLSPNSGLIEWVPDCDTLHILVREYRENRKILLNIENRLMLAMAPDFENLPVIGKVEVFQHALTSTTGQDLNKVLWLKSNNAEDWLLRRTNYTRSLALMSMVGYILGLGDRHPSNLMLHKYTGKIVHIDFGDCFEVAMQREKFPEKVPFRLTRMLVNAMEVSGIEGTFRFTCESVMKVLRANKGSVMAMLEAFVHDPLINWRLLGGEKQNRNFEPEAKDTPPADNHAPSMQQHPPPPRGMAPFDSEEAEGSGSSQGSTDDEGGGEGGEEGGEHHARANSELPHSLRPRYGSLHLRGIENHAITASEVLNEKAVKVINRVQNKLTGRDFNPDTVLSIEEQVDKLIRQATSKENLSQSYVGWCPFW